MILIKTFKKTMIKIIIFLQVLKNLLACLLIH